ncbi:hypothetical protein [Paenibacillus agilis]|uniref:hypothetical protein n=1 Tax=Paenibacillus agilis TaxID=3020863 RepID=UPI00164A03AC|nr:hypothetical protein [Paenibacillus agilis]
MATVREPLKLTIFYNTDFTKVAPPHIPVSPPMSQDGSYLRLMKITSLLHLQNQ